jgi:hypothetical protein
MKYDVLDNNGYVCTCDNLKSARLVKKNGDAGGCIQLNRGPGVGKLTYKLQLPINIRPHERYIEKPVEVCLTKKISRKISKAAEKAQPLLELDGFRLIDEV